MFYLLYGKDTFRSRQKLNEILSAFRLRHSNLGFFNLNEDNFSKEGLTELTSSQTLFETKSIVVCENILENKEATDFVLEHVDNLSQAQNIFIFLEAEVGEKVLESFSTKAQKAQSFDLLTGASLVKHIKGEMEKLKIKKPEAVLERVLNRCGSDLWCVSKELDKISLGGEMEEEHEHKEFNLFQICDAVAEKNKRKAWLILQQARMAGVPDEEIFWKIVWEVKTLLSIKNLVDSGSNNIEKESGLHPFVVKKALNNLKNYTKDELIEMSYRTLDFYHKARINLTDWEVGLEKLVIN